MIDGILGIDVSKNTLDVSISSCTKVRSKSFANSSDCVFHKNGTVASLIPGQQFR